LEEINLNSLILPIFVQVASAGRLRGFPSPVLSFFAEELSGYTEINLLLLFSFYCDLHEKPIQLLLRLPALTLG
jgi:hypothetical protein